MFFKRINVTKTKSHSSLNELNLLAKPELLKGGLQTKQNRRTDEILTTSSELCKAE